MPTLAQRRAAVLFGGQFFNNGSVNVPYSAYSLLDIFDDARAAGAVNGTLPVVGGARVAVDTNSRLSIAGGVAVYATGTGAAGDPGLWYATQARVFGKVLIGTVTFSQTNRRFSFGWDTGQTGKNLGPTIFFDNNGSAYPLNNDLTTGGAGNFTYTAATYQLAVVLRGTGAYFFVKGQTFTNWTLWGTLDTGTTTPLFPGLGLYENGAGAFTADNVRVPIALYTSLPYLAYDTFTRANGALGSSETTGPDGQAGTARAWTVQTGTIAIVSNTASATAVPAIATEADASADVMVDAAITRTAGSGGIILRYADANNYLRATTDGTNCLLEQVVAGTPTTLRTGAVTYADGNVIRVTVSGTTGMLFYNGAAVGASFTVPSSSATAHGLYGTDTSCLFDNYKSMAVNTGYDGWLNSV